jgi:hypothetical protein
VTREKYQKRFEKFFDFLHIEEKTIEEKSNVFVDVSRREESGWLLNQVLKFMQFQLDRFNNKEITGSTIRKYLKSIKLFCELADFSIRGKKHEGQLVVFYLLGFGKRDMSLLCNFSH